MKTRAVRLGFFKAIVMGLSLLLAIAIAEGVLRIVEPKGLYNQRVNLRGLKVRIVEGTELWDSPDMLRYTPADLAAAAKDRASYRIAGIGDSIMFGVNLKAGDTYMELLEKELNGRSPRAVRTVNLAVPGYNIAQEYSVFKERGAALAPDLLIVHFWADDFQQYKIIHGAAYDESFSTGGGKVVLRTIPLPRPWNDFLIARSRLYQKLSLAGLMLRRSKRGDSELQHVQDVIGSLAREAAKTDTRVLMLFSPRLENGRLAALQGNVLKGYRIVEKTAADHGFDTLDLTAALQPFSGEIIGLDECHFNEKGHRILAHILAERIASGYLNTGSRDRRPRAK